MNTRNIEKLSGYANLIYALCFIIYVALWYVLLPHEKAATDYLAMIQNSNWTLVCGFGFAGLLFSIIGMIGISINVSDSKMGLIGSLMGIIGLLLQLCIISWDFTIFPIIASHTPSFPLMNDSIINTNSGVISIYSLYTLIYSIGFILVGISFAKKTEYPKWIGISIIIGAPIFAFGIIVSDTIAMAGLLIYIIGIAGIGLQFIKQ